MLELDNLPVELWYAIFVRINSLRRIWRLRQVSPLFRKLAEKTIHQILLGRYPHCDAFLRPPRLELWVTSRCLRKDNTTYPLRVASIDEDKGTVNFGFLLSQNSKNNSTQPQRLHSGHGFRGFGKLLGEFCGKSYPVPSVSITPDLDSVVETNDSEKKVEYPSELLEEVRKEPLAIGQFLTDAWADITAHVPRALLVAYNSLFKHIFGTFRYVCMQPELLLNPVIKASLLAQSWRVINILAPASFRDVRICNENACCGLETTIKIRCVPDIPYISHSQHAGHVHTSDETLSEVASDLRTTSGPILNSASTSTIAGPGTNPSPSQLSAGRSHPSTLASAELDSTELSKDALEFEINVEDIQKQPSTELLLQSEVGSVRTILLKTAELENDSTILESTYLLYGDQSENISLVDMSLALPIQKVVAMYGDDI